MTPGEQKERVHQHSGWLLPAGFVFVIMLLSGLLLGWYLRPGAKAPAALTGYSELVPVILGDLRLMVPANYMQNPAQRSGGPQNSLSLTTLFPSWQGYSAELARRFQGNAPDSAVVRVQIHRDANTMDAATRLARIYGPNLAAPEGVAGPFGLRQYGFADNSGYEQNDLFVGGSGDGLVLFLCQQPTPDLPSPNCQATDRPLAAGDSYSFRFKRAWLARWRELSGGVDALIARFRKTG
jgi:hypothetical protein